MCRLKYFICIIITLNAVVAAGANLSMEHIMVGMEDLSALTPLAMKAIARSPHLRGRDALEAYQQNASQDKDDETWQILDGEQVVGLFCWNPLVDEPNLKNIQNIASVLGSSVFDAELGDLNIPAFQYALREGLSGLFPVGSDVRKLVYDMSLLFSVGNEWQMRGGVLAVLVVLLECFPDHADLCATYNQFSSANLIYKTSSVAVWKDAPTSVETFFRLTVPILQSLVRLRTGMMNDEIQIAECKEGLQVQHFCLAYWLGPFYCKGMKKLGSKKLNMTFFRHDAAIPRPIETDVNSCLQSLCSLPQLNNLQQLKEWINSCPYSSTSEHVPRLKRTISLYDELGQMTLSSREKEEKRRSVGRFMSAFLTF